MLNFVAITSCDPDKAAQYLSLTDNNLEQAIQLYFDSPNLDFGGAPVSQPAATNAASTQNPITIDSDDEMDDFDAGLQSNTPPGPQPNMEDDEAMARRLQEEMYSGGGGAGGLGPDEVRAPMERRTETLVGPGASMGPMEHDADLDALVQEQIARRRAPGELNWVDQRFNTANV